MKRYPKWCKNWTVPNNGVIPPSDYIIQKIKRSASQVVHGDKLKLCHGEVPKSWLCEVDKQNEDVAEKQSESLLARDAHSRGHLRISLTKKITAGIQTPRVVCGLAGR